MGLVGKELSRHDNCRRRIIQCNDYAEILAKRKRLVHKLCTRRQLTKNFQVLLMYSRRFEGIKVATD